MEPNRRYEQADLFFVFISLFFFWVTEGILRAQRYSVGLTDSLGKRVI